MIQEDEPDYELHAFKQVNESAIELIKAMLSKKGDDRPSAQECLNYHWLTQ